MASAGFLLHILNSQLYYDCGIELGEREVSEPGVVRFFLCLYLLVGTSRTFLLVTACFFYTF